MKLGGYYKKAVLYPLLLVVLFVILFSIADNYDYKSEWMTAGEVISLSIVVSVIYGLIVSALATTIFLNKIKRVRSNKWLSFLSWFLLPFGFIGAIVAYILLYENDEAGNGFTYLLLINVPFILGLTWSYYKYRKANSDESRSYKTEAGKSATN